MPTNMNIFLQKRYSFFSLRKTKDSFIKEYKRALDEIGPRINQDREYNQSLGESTAEAVKATQGSIITTEKVTSKYKMLLQMNYCNNKMDNARGLSKRVFIISRVLLKKYYPPLLFFFFFYQ